MKLSKNTLLSIFSIVVVLWSLLSIYGIINGILEGLKPNTETSPLAWFLGSLFHVTMIWLVFRFRKAFSGRLLRTEFNLVSKGERTLIIGLLVLLLTTSLISIINPNNISEDKFETSQKVESMLVSVAPHLNYRTIEISVQAMVWIIKILPFLVLLYLLLLVNYLNANNLFEKTAQMNQNSTDF